jgi:hypothetical protein
VCEQLGLVVRNGAVYTDATTGERLGIGKDNVKRVLEDDPALSKRLSDAVYATISASAQVPVEGSSGTDEYFTEE